MTTTGSFIIRRSGVDHASQDWQRIASVDSSDLEVSQAYFWTEAWQAGERRASEDIEAGRITTISGPDELESYFKQIANKHRSRGGRRKR